MKKIYKIIFIIIISFSLNLKNIQAQSNELPKVYLTGDITNMNTKDDIRELELSFKSKNLSFESYATIKIQGATSLAYDKKNYTIKLYEDKEYTTKKKIDVGFGKESKYYLKANWIDKTHSRNIVTARITADIQNKYNLFNNTPNNSQIDGFPVEIYINNDFYGLYTWNIPKDEWLLNMNKKVPNHIIIMAKGHNKFEKTTTLNDTNWEIEVGPETQKTIDKFNTLITFIKDSNNIEFKNDFENHLNLDATLNYYIITKFASLADNINKNMLLSTYDGQIWYPILYDLDTSWGTNWKGSSTIDYTSLFEEDYNDNLLWHKFEKNFSKEITNRYFELRKNILTKENVLNKFNKFINSIPKDTLEKEIDKWKENIPGYDINQIEEFLDTRIPILDKEMYNSYNITPQISIEYSTQKPTLKPVTIKFIPNRTDITIIKDGKKINKYNYTFKENGEYTFEYQDWYGNNLGTLTITINNIKTKEATIALISLILILAGVILIKTSNKKHKKKKTKIKSQKKTKKKYTKK